MAIQGTLCGKATLEGGQKTSAHPLMRCTLRTVCLLSKEEGEHNVEKFMLCSFAHHACSPLLQESLHELKLCKESLTCHLSLDVLCLCQK